MANRWGENGNSEDFIFLGSKITGDGDCRHVIKRHLLPGRKAMTNLALLTKVHIAQAMVFPVVMHRYESWTIKKAECCRLDAFELWCWRRLLRVPWTTRRSNQSILKEINPEYSLEGLTLKLKLQYTLAIWCGALTHWKRPWSWGRLRAGAEGRTEDKMVGWHHRLNGQEFEQTPGDNEGLGSLACCSSRCSRVSHELVPEQAPSPEVLNQGQFCCQMTRGNIWRCFWLSQPAKGINY